MDTVTEAATNTLQSMSISPEKPSGRIYKNWKTWIQTIIKENRAPNLFISGGAAAKFRKKDKDKKKKKKKQL